MKNRDVYRRVRQDKNARKLFSGILERKTGLIKAMIRVVQEAGSEGVTVESWMNEVGDRSWFFGASREMLVLCGWIACTGSNGPLEGDQVYAWEGSGDERPEWVLKRVAHGLSGNRPSEGRGARKRTKSPKSRAKSPKSRTRRTERKPGKRKGDNGSDD